MKIIETNGITYLEKFDCCSEWYWGTNYTSGALAVLTWKSSKTRD